MRDEELAELGQQLRVDAVRAAAAAGSGHPTSSMSAADLAAVLLARHLRYDFDRPDHPGNDRLILSKGHASPLLYALYRAAGVIDDAELLTFRRDGSPLEGHPTPRLPWVDVATGSLGQGLPVGVGMALAGKRVEQVPYRIWVLCGDSEMAEGSVWEAAEHAAFERLDNLVLIVDVNRLGQRGPTREGWDLDAYERRLRAFGWLTTEVDGHDIAAVDAALGAGVASVVFCTLRFAPDTETWIEEQSALGGWFTAQARWLGARYAHGVDSVSPPSPWRRERGGLWDVGPHALSVLIPILGDVTSLSAVPGPADTVHLTLRHSSGASSALTLGLSAPAGAAGTRVELLGDHGKSVMPKWNDPVTAFRGAIDELRAAIRTDRPHPCDIRFGLRLTELLAEAESQLS
uniref:Gfo/Idh/MocA family protein n=1 Tax=Streptomyces clavuligerus TaxID=1901 RepID=UPI0022B0B91C|nr:thiamine pyrophosphate-dependent enzyme [Streptomyces clavuligerus]